MTFFVYTVQLSDEKDGLRGIAQRLYGNANDWVALYEASRGLIGHNPNIIHAGQHLIVPEMVRGTRTSLHVYIVQTTDIYEGLPHIANKIWNHAERWPLLSAINRGVIGNDPSRLQVGQCLLIPSEQRAMEQR